MTLETGRCGIAENQNWWNYNPAFNGTAGIGRGTTPPNGPLSHWGSLLESKHGNPDRGSECDSKRTSLQVPLDKRLD